MELLEISPAATGKFLRAIGMDFWYITTVLQHRRDCQRQNRKLTWSWK